MSPRKHLNPLFPGARHAPPSRCGPVHVRRAARVAAAVVLLASSTTACAGEEPARGQASRTARLAPPAAVTCDRNQLTSYTGRVTRLETAAGQTTLEIATDWDTAERVTIEHPGANDASARYLRWSKPWDATSSAVATPGTRATAWVCSDGVTPPLIDWQPPQE